MLNENTKRNAFPLPRVDKYKDALEGLIRFSPFNLPVGFYQVAMRPEDRKKTAFTTSFVLCNLNRMPFGLSNSTSTFQRFLQSIMNNSF